MQNHRPERHRHRLPERAGTFAAVAALLSLGGCGTTSPSDLPMSGRYTLVVTASSVCQLSATTFQWELEATSAAVTNGAAVRATLPAGDATVDVSVTETVGRGSEANAAGNITTRSAAFGREPLRATITGGARGTVTASADGRGQVLDGVLNGSIALSNAGDRATNTLGACTAADHRWTLNAR